MTPFDLWYAREVESKLPADFPPQLAKAGKVEAAKVWNAAIDAMRSVERTMLRTADWKGDQKVFQEELESLRARVTP
jgi:hypothetical protein